MPEVPTANLEVEPAETATSTTAVSSTSKAKSIPPRKLLIVSILVVTLVVLGVSAAIVLNQLGQKQNNPDVTPPAQTPVPEPTPVPPAQVSFESGFFYIDQDQVWHYTFTSQKKMQITSSELPIQDFVVSEDKTRLAYSVSNSELVQAGLATIPAEDTYGNEVNLNNFEKQLPTRIYITDLTSSDFRTQLIIPDIAIDMGEVNPDYLGGPTSSAYWKDRGIDIIGFSPDSEQLLYTYQGLISHDLILGSEVKITNTITGDVIGCYSIHSPLWVDDKLIITRRCWEWSEQEIYQLVGQSYTLVETAELGTTFGLTNSYVAAAKDFAVLKNSVSDDSGVTRSFSLVPLENLTTAIPSQALYEYPITTHLINRISLNAFGNDIVILDFDFYISERDESISFRVLSFREDTGYQEEPLGKVTLSLIYPGDFDIYCTLSDCVVVESYSDVGKLGRSIRHLRLGSNEVTDITSTEVESESQSLNNVVQLVKGN